jgi:hypothetical protein
LPPLVGLIVKWHDIYSARQSAKEYQNYLNGVQPEEKKPSNIALMWQSFTKKVCFKVEFTGEE